MVNRGDYRFADLHPCGRKVVEDGLCGIHLRAKKMREENDKKYQDMLDKGKKLRETADELTKALGVEVAPDYFHGYSGKMVVPLEFLQEIAKRKSEAMRNENSQR